MQLGSAPSLRGRRRDLDDLGASRGPTVRAAAREEIPALLSFTRQKLPHSTVQLQVVERIHQWNEETFLVVDGAEAPAGVAALLLLNSRGLDALLTGGFSFDHPDLRHLARSGEAPAGIYVWALCMTGRAVAALWAIMDWSKQRGREHAHLYARPGTPEGERFMRHGGFRPITCGQPDLWRYERRHDDRLTGAA